MTEGTSQGLFIVVAIVIFGIFVSLSYTLFGSQGLSNDLKGLFENAVEQTSNSVNSPLKVDTSENEDGSVSIKAYNQNKNIEVDSLEFLSAAKNINILGNSDFKEPLSEMWNKYGIAWGNRGNTTKGIDNKTLIDGYPTLKFVKLDVPNPNGTPNDFSLLHRSGLIDVGDTVTLSFEAFSLEDTDFVVRFGAEGIKQEPQIVKLSNNSSRYSVTLTKNLGNTNSFSFMPRENTTIWFSKFQIEKGTKSTGWTPYDTDNFVKKEKDLIILKVYKNGTYKFKMKDSKGKEYFEKVVIDYL